MNYIIYDIEATCWRGSPPGLIQETIEIGAVKCNYYGEVLGQFSRFIKPKINPELSLFCRQLTHIRQSDIDIADSFESVIHDFMDWIDVYDEDYMLCSWGSFDKKQLKLECDIYDIEEDWLEQHINLKNQYREILKLRQAKGLSKALKAEGIEFTGTPHRAISDAQNTAKIFMRHVDEWRV